MWNKNFVEEIVKYGLVLNLLDFNFSTRFDRFKWSGTNPRANFYVLKSAARYPFNLHGR